MLDKWGVRYKIILPDGTAYGTVEVLPQAEGNIV